MDMNLVRNAVEFFWEILDGRLKKESIRQSTFIGLAIDLLGDLLKWTGVRIDPDHELPRIQTSTVVYKCPVAGPDIDDDPFAGRN
jgi:hypothetical protein